jgi:hypothetical protein
MIKLSFFIIFLFVIFYQVTTADDKPPKPAAKLKKTDRLAVDNHQILKFTRQTSSFSCF